MGLALSKDALEDRSRKVWHRCCFAWNRWLHPILHYGAVPAIFALGLAANGELTANPITLFQKLILN
ncbi:hypothetical protein, conserved [Eimeria acervulina]|uniref:Uncharacterized protein n=1 Tax=Eimeria acervulina TaxID=5801 RepID=U6GIT9_EIMAC|nr:hypothetical protein, conserved [Eimeria acervulina]CDI80156.1 hypothetical protein, conserved [Eimeria acervulina]